MLDIQEDLEHEGLRGRKSIDGFDPVNDSKSSFSEWITRDCDLTGCPKRNPGVRSNVGGGDREFHATVL